MVNLFWQISVNLNLQLIITLWDKSVYSENEKSHPTWNLKINGKQSNFPKYNKKLKSKKFRTIQHPSSTTLLPMNTKLFGMEGNIR